MFNAVRSTQFAARVGAALDVTGMSVTATLAAEDSNPDVRLWSDCCAVACVHVSGLHRYC